MSKQFGSIPTEVYHGTSSDNYQRLKKGIDVNIGIANTLTDFGKGFYTTTNYEQALTQANRKTNKYNNAQKRTAKKIEGFVPKFVEPVVFNYKIDVPKLEELSVISDTPPRHLIFHEPNDSWAEFILNNRSFGKTISDFHNSNQNFHYVYGPLADGFIYNLVKEYFQEKISWRDFMVQITPHKNGSYYQDQLSIHTLEAVKCLSLKEVR